MEKRNRALLWIVALAVTTPLVVITLTVGHRNSVQRREAELKRQRVRENDVWRQATTPTTQAGLMAYLEGFPEGRFAADAHTLLREERAWTDTLKPASRPFDFKRFLTQYPSSRHADEARKGLADEEVWDRFRSRNSASATDRLRDVDNYLSILPGGRHSAQAVTVAHATLAAIDDHPELGSAISELRRYLSSQPTGPVVPLARIMLERKEHRLLAEEVLHLLSDAISTNVIASTAYIVVDSTPTNVVVRKLHPTDSLIKDLHSMGWRLSNLRFPTQCVLSSAARGRLASPTIAGPRVYEMLQAEHGSLVPAKYLPTYRFLNNQITCVPNDEILNDPFVFLDFFDIVMVHTGARVGETSYLDLRTLELFSECLTDCCDGCVCPKVETARSPAPEDLDPQFLADVKLAYPAERARWVTTRLAESPHVTRVTVNSNID